MHPSRAVAAGVELVPLVNRRSSSGRLMRALTAATVAYCLPGAALALVHQPVLAAVLVVVRGAAFVVIDVMRLPRDELTAHRRDQLAPAVASFRRVSILASASHSALERLAVNASLEEVAADTVVVREGDVADAFYVVVDGRLGVASTGGTGEPPAMLGDLGAGDCFGEIGLVHRRPRTATVTTLTACTLYRVPGVDFLSTVTASPASRPPVFELARTRIVRSHGREADMEIPPDVWPPGAEETSESPEAREEGP